MSNKFYKTIKSPARECTWCNKRDCSKVCEYCNNEMSCLVFEAGHHGTKCTLCEKTCIDLTQHNIKCDLCNTQGCGNKSYQRWRSWKTNVLHTVCMDCIYEGAMYVKALNHFTAK